MAETVSRDEERGGLGRPNDPGFTCGCANTPHATHGATGAAVRCKPPLSSHRLDKATLALTHEVIKQGIVSCAKLKNIIICELIQHTIYLVDLASEAYHTTVNQYIVHQLILLWPNRDPKGLADAFGQRLLKFLSDVFG